MMTVEQSTKQMRHNGQTTDHMNFHDRETIIGGCAYLLKVNCYL